MKYEKRREDDALFLCVCAELRGGHHNKPSTALSVHPREYLMWSKKCDVIKIIKVHTHTHHSQVALRSGIFSEIFLLCYTCVYLPLLSEPSRFHRVRFFLCIVNWNISEWTNKQANWIRTIKRCIWIIQLHVCNSHNILGDLIMARSHSVESHSIFHSASSLMMWITPDVQFYRLFFFPFFALSLEWYSEFECLCVSVREKNWF